MELLLGCGNSRARLVSWADHEGEWKELTTLDIDPETGCDIVHDLNELPWPLPDAQFDEVHAYDVLEHIGTQGDWQAFFAHFDEIYRILKPGGFLVITTPAWDGRWAWGDPGHRRTIQGESLSYLDRETYAQVGRTAMTDYRKFFKCDFATISGDTEGERHGFVLQKR